MWQKFEMMTGLRMLLLTVVYVGTLEWVGEDRTLLSTLMFSMFYIGLCGVVLTEGYRIRLVNRRENASRLVFESGIFTVNEAREFIKNR